MKEFHVQKVVTRNFIADFIASIQNLAGKRMRTYERMMDEGINACWKDIADQKIKVKWYRVQITDLSTGAIAIMIYGEAD